MSQKEIPFLFKWALDGLIFGGMGGQGLWEAVKFR